MPEKDRNDTRTTNKILPFCHEGPFAYNENKLAVFSTELRRYRNYSAISRNASERLQNTEIFRAHL